MSASYLGAVLVFCAVGIISLWRYLSQHPIAGISVIDYAVAAFILLNGVFFLYIELYTETDQDEIERLKNVHVTQWMLRVVNQVNLTLTWVWLDYGMIYCAGSLLLFYVIILTWDAVVFRSPQYNTAGLSSSGLNIVFHDVIGFVAVLGVASVVHYFEVDHRGIFHAGMKLQEAEGIIILNTFLIIFVLAFAINAYFVIQKVRLDLGRLASREHRV